MTDKTTLITDAPCPACGHHISVPFYDGGAQPLATIAWPESHEAALAMPKLALDFVSCVECGHIFNRAFRYSDVPYTDKPNLMFNRGAGWSQFIHGIQEELLSHLSDKPVVVEIGHGDGSFLAQLASLRPNGRYIGFDPHGARGNIAGVEFNDALFHPMEHLPALKPNLIIMRHVLEHFESSLNFLQQLSFAVAWHGTACLAYLEVPCVDRVFDTQRTVDFYYEHNSQFTTSSFTKMLERAGLKPEKIGHGYDGEVIYGLVGLATHPARLTHAKNALAFHHAATESKPRIQEQLSVFLQEGRSIAVWGGTGKSAAFMQRYDMDNTRFPHVVDSDAQKAGTFVPGTGQVIRHADWLIDNPQDIIIIPPQWRAADIVSEITRKNIRYQAALIEHHGRLVDFMHSDHPYKKEG